MMEVGFSEILLISVLALIVLGPEKLPKVAAEIGRWVGRARSMARQFREQLDEEVSLESVHKRADTPAAGAASAATGASAAIASAAITPEADTAVSSAAVPAAELPVQNVGPAQFESQEFVPDQAELTPHSPIEDDVDSHVDSHAESTSNETPPNERLPRL